MANIIVFHDKQKGRTASLINHLCKTLDKKKWRKLDWFYDYIPNAAGRRTWFTASNVNKYGAGLCFNVDREKPLKILLHKKSALNDLKEMLTGFRSEKLVLIEVVD
jgi:hypothetical protein